MVRKDQDPVARKSGRVGVFVGVGGIDAG